MEIPLAALSLLGAWWVVRSRDHAGALALVIVTLVALGIALGGLLHRIRGRYVVTLLPWFCILAAIGLRAVVAWTGRRAVAVLAGGLACAALGYTTRGQLELAQDRADAYHMLLKTLRRGFPDRTVIFITAARHDDGLRLFGLGAGRASNATPADAVAIRERLTSDPSTVLVVDDEGAFWLAVAGLDAENELHRLHRIDLPGHDGPHHMDVYESLR